MRPPQQGEEKHNRDCQTLLDTFYEDLYEQYGDSPEAVGLIHDRQALRFRILSEIGLRSHGTILDVGCGLGHFREFLGVTDDRYKGVDIYEGFLRAARAKHGNFYSVHDILREDIPKNLHSDWVVMGGVLNLKTDHNDTGTKVAISRCFDACNKGVAIGMLSSHAPEQSDIAHYYDPVKMLAAALDLTPTVMLRHDYLDNDFTLYLWRTT